MLENKYEIDREKNTIIIVSHGEHKVYTIINNCMQTICTGFLVYELHDKHYVYTSVFNGDCFVWDVVECIGNLYDAIRFDSMSDLYLLVDKYTSIKWSDDMTLDERIKKLKNEMQSSSRKDESPEFVTRKEYESLLKQLDKHERSIITMLQLMQDSSKK
jgi:hypothetical protein